MNTKHLRGNKVRKVVKRGLRKLARTDPVSFPRFRADKLMAYALYMADTPMQRLVKDIMFLPIAWTGRKDGDGKN